jgi:hypothetical protein
MDRLLANETILRIFGYLDASDLVRIQAVSSHFRALAKDRHLWKRLFFLAFVHPTLASGSFDSARDAPLLPTLRELRSLLLHQHLPIGKHVPGDGLNRIARIPQRFYASQPGLDHAARDPLSSDDSEDRIADQHLDWEQIYRVSSKWQNGNFAASQLLSASRSQFGGPSPKAVPEQAHSTRLESPATIVRMSSSFILTAAPCDDPEVLVYPCDNAPSRAEHASSSAPVPSHGDLHDRTPIARFTSPSLQRLMSQRPLDAELHRARVTEITVDALSVDLALNPVSSDTRKRKYRETAEVDAGSVATVVVAYSSGHVGLFALKGRGPAGHVGAQVDELAFLDTRTFSPGTHVCMAALHSPALVLCSSRFDISFFRIASSPTESLKLEMVQRLSSFRCSWPASLRLKPLPCHQTQSKRSRRWSRSRSSERADHEEHDQEVAFRATLAYSSPSYPSSWSVSVEEIVIRFHANRPHPTAQVSSRHATARHSFRPTPLDLRGRSMLGGGFAALAPPGGAAQRADLDAASRSRTTTLTYDDPFVVVGASDNMLDVYELVGATTYVRQGAPTLGAGRSATATSLAAREALQLVHRRRLHGHTGSVHSVALEDGRCVSGGADGSVMVWSLGDRANDTESIASFMRSARATARGAGNASATMDEEDAEQAASSMTHVLTLRTPMEAEDRVQVGRAPGQTPQAGLSLSQIVRSRVFDRQARGVIRWVSTAFDKIVSVVAYSDASRTCHADALEETAGQARERIQVWSFG